MTSQLLAELEQWKTFVQTDLAEECKRRYSETTFEYFIKPYLDDMLENFEGAIEQVATQTLHDEELSYDNNYEGE